MIKKIARFVCRPGPDGEPDLIVGVCFRGSSLKPNRIYQIDEILGELTIADLGPSAISDRPYNKTGRMGWKSDISSIIENWRSTIILTVKEAANAFRDGK